jgi:hypothetical protein
VFGSSGDLAIDFVASDANAPIKGLPAMRFDLMLAREGAAGTGRVGADPSQIVKAKPGETATSYNNAPTAAQSKAAAPAAEKKGFLARMFGG